MIELKTPKPPPAEVDDDGKPVDKTPRVEVFSIDGTTYSIADKVVPSIGLRYLHLVRIGGLAVATDWLLERTLGEEGHAALISFESITAEEISRVAAAVRSVVFGDVKVDGEGAPKARGGTKRPRSTRTR